MSICHSNVIWYIELYFPYEGVINQQVSKIQVQTNIIRVFSLGK